MRVTFDVNLLSSFMLYIDHVLQANGDAYYNYSGNLYSVQTKIANTYAYATPFRQLVSDTSISGATVMSGVYLNNNFVGVGQSGLSMINHDLGTVYFTGQLPASTAISGRYSVKDFSIQYTDKLEYKLLFETKYVSNSKFNQVLSGLAADTKTCPAIFLKTRVTENKGFSFGGLDDNNFKIRAILIADNEFQKISANNILKNVNFKTFNITSSHPFDHLGNYTGLNYNYNNLSFLPNYEALITEVKVIDVPLKGEYQDIGRSVGMLDFEVSVIMRH